MRLTGRCANSLVIAIALVAIAGCDVLRVPSPTIAILQLKVENIAFDVALLRAPANAPFIVHLQNADPADLPHTVEVRRPDGVTVVKTQTPIDGRMQIDYAFDPLPPGDYVFICNIHPIPQMTGVLQVR